MELAGLECLDVGRVVFGDGLGNVLDEIDKDRRLGGKVGLGVDLDGDADAVLDGGIGHALGGDAAGLLGGLRKTLLAEPFDGLVHVAVGLNEGLLAVHHADIGHFAQGFYISSSECHSLFPPVYYSAAFSASAAGASLLASP